MLSSPNTIQWCTDLVEHFDLVENLKKCSDQFLAPQPCKSSMQQKILRQPISLLNRYSTVSLRWEKEKRMQYLLKVAVCLYCKDFVNHFPRIVTRHGQHVKRLNFVLPSKYAFSCFCLVITPKWYHTEYHKCLRLISDMQQRGRGLSQGGKTQSTFCEIQNFATQKMSVHQLFFIFQRI